MSTETCNFTGTDQVTVTQISDLNFMEERACNTQVCTDYHWVWAEWGRCSLPCGGGVQVSAHATPVG